MSSRDEQIINKIMQEITIAIGMMRGITESSFLSDEKLKRAVSMTLINIGELVKNLTAEFTNMHREVPWKEITGFRDIAAHKYQSLRMEDVYLTVTEDLPALRNSISKIVN
jgi:uncharacterized protein with HEPN domain